MPAVASGRSSRNCAAVGARGGDVASSAGSRPSRCGSNVWNGRSGWPDWPRRPRRRAPAMADPAVRVGYAIVPMDTSRIRSPEFDPRRSRRRPWERFIASASRARSCSRSSSRAGGAGVGGQRSHAAPDRRHDRRRQRQLRRQLRLVHRHPDPARAGRHRLRDRVLGRLLAARRARFIAHDVADDHDNRAGEGNHHIGITGGWYSPPCSENPIGTGPLQQGRQGVGDLPVQLQAEGVPRRSTSRCRRAAPWSARRSRARCA